MEAGLFPRPLRGMPVPPLTKIVKICQARHPGRLFFAVPFAGAGRRDVRVGAAAGRGRVAGAGLSRMSGECPAGDGVREDACGAALCGGRDGVHRIAVRFRGVPCRRVPAGNAAGSSPGGGAAVGAGSRKLLRDMRSYRRVWGRRGSCLGAGHCGSRGMRRVRIRCSRPCRRP